MTTDKLCQYESWHSRRTTITSDEAGTYGCRRPVPLSLQTAPFPLVCVVHPPVCSLDGVVRLPSLKYVSSVTGGRSRRGGRTHVSQPLMFLPTAFSLLFKPPRGKKTPVPVRAASSPGWSPRPAPHQVQGTKTKKKYSAEPRSGLYITSKREETAAENWSCSQRCPACTIWWAQVLLYKPFRSVCPPSPAHAMGGMRPLCRGLSWLACLKLLFCTLDLHELEKCCGVCRWKPYLKTRCRSQLNHAVLSRKSGLILTVCFHCCSVSACACVCACVWEREIERERARGWWRNYFILQFISCHLTASPCTPTPVCSTVLGCKCLGWNSHSRGFFGCTGVQGQKWTCICGWVESFGDWRAVVGETRGHRWPLTWGLTERCRRSLLSVGAMGEQWRKRRALSQWMDNGCGSCCWRPCW